MFEDVLRDSVEDIGHKDHAHHSFVIHYRHEVEKFAANPVTGSASMTVPLAVSPGRAGFGPQLSLSYDSGNGNGPFGFGWSLSLPRISRKTDKGLPLYHDAKESDVFLLSGAEDLVPVLLPNETRHEDTTSQPGFTIHQYRPRVESLFARIERWTEDATGDVHWRSITRENVTTIYGRTNDSRVFDPSETASPHPRRIFEWLVCESYDDKGNAIVYEYAAENEVHVNRMRANERNRVRTANRYLKRIRYGNRVSRLIEPDLSKAEWLFEVVFDYDEGHYAQLPLDSARPEAEQHRFAQACIDSNGDWHARPDPFSVYRAGFEVRSYRRCRRVLMFHRFAELGPEPCLVRATEFEYDDLVDYEHDALPSLDAELGIKEARATHRSSAAPSNRGTSVTNRNRSNSETACGTSRTSRNHFPHSSSSTAKRKSKMRFTISTRRAKRTSPWASTAASTSGWTSTAKGFPAS